MFLLAALLKVSISEQQETIIKPGAEWAASGNMQMKKTCPIVASIWPHACSILREKCSIVTKPDHFQKRAANTENTTNKESHMGVSSKQSPGGKMMDMSNHTCNTTFVSMVCASWSYWSWLSGSGVRKWINIFALHFFVLTTWLCDSDIVLSFCWLLAPHLQ